MSMNRYLFTCVILLVVVACRPAQHATPIAVPQVTEQQAIAIARHYQESVLLGSILTDTPGRARLSPDGIWIVELTAKPSPLVAPDGPVITVRTAVRIDGTVVTNMVWFT